jgi:uncharacterized protein (DUF983 family)
LLGVSNPERDHNRSTFGGKKPRQEANNDRTSSRKQRSVRNLHTPHTLRMTRHHSTLISTALRRGVRKRCPHCGEGELFSRWSHFERCSNCGLVFERNPGDTWAFTVIGDRLPIAAIIVLIYFGVMRSHRVLGLTMLVALAVLLVWTAPNRWGVGIALHYLSRVYWPDPADPLPSVRDKE